MPMPFRFDCCRSLFSPDSFRYYYYFAAAFRLAAIHYAMPLLPAYAMLLPLLRFHVFAMLLLLMLFHAATPYDTMLFFRC